MQPCDYRGAQLASGVFVCSSNRPRLPEAGLTTIEFCSSCRFANLPQALVDSCDESPQATELQLDAAGCTHRGDKLRGDLCDVCGLRGQSFTVYTCELHGECSVRKYQRRVRACLNCDDFKPRSPKSAGEILAENQ